MSPVKKLLSILGALIGLAGMLLQGFSFAEAGPVSEGSASFPLIGEWAFEYEPKTLVLRIGEDGTAWYRNQDYTWTAQDGFLQLTAADGRTVSLRYTAGEDRKVIYPQTSYHRGKHVDGQGGLIGIWEGVSDLSTFVFTPAGYFLEDNAFSGQFLNNEAEGTFLLHYGKAFADTICYYSITDEILTVEYPWVIIEKQN